MTTLSKILNAKGQNGTSIELLENKLKIHLLESQN